MDIQLNAPSLDANMLQHVLAECIKNVLFMHGQLPAPFDDLCRQQAAATNQEEECTPIARRRWRRGASKQKAIARCISSIESLLTALRQAVKEIPRLCGALLLLGRSSERPKEVYHILFKSGEYGLDLDDRDAPIAAEMQTTGPSSVIARKVIREMVLADLPYKRQGPLRFFLLLEGNTLHEPVNDFLPKQDYNLVMKKAEPVVIRLHTQSADSSLNSDLSADKLEVGGSLAAEARIWYQCTVAVKGLASGSAQAD